MAGEFWEEGRQNVCSQHISWALKHALGDRSFKKPFK